MDESIVSVYKICAFQNCCHLLTYNLFLWEGMIKQILNDLVVQQMSSKLVKSFENYQGTNKSETPLASHGNMITDRNNEKNEGFFFSLKEYIKKGHNKFQKQF